MEKKNQFSSKIGFILAAAGSAVGLGNIWRFPYLTAKYGGAFLITYIVLVLTFGFTLMLTEIAIGRKTGKSPFHAFKQIHPKAGIIGIIASLVSFLILPYYSVIGGWVMKYLVGYVSGAGATLADPAFFGSYIGQTWQPVLWQAAFVLVTLGVILLGVQKGVEKASRILMPALVVLSLIIAVYSLTLPGAFEGVKYMLIPDFSGYSLNLVLAAMGQMFYSMSLAMGIMITYGSYMRKEDNLTQSIHHIEIFDTGVSILAGLMIIPAVFAISGSDASINAGPGLMFQTLPQVFGSMKIGSIVGLVFFLLVLFAALTSSISLMETTTATIAEHFKLSRTKSALLTATLSILLGVPSSLGFSAWSNFNILGLSVLDFFDTITNSIMMPIVALATCILIGWVVGIKPIEDEVALSGELREKKMVQIMLRWIAPVLLVAILISGLLNTFGIITL